MGRIAMTIALAMTLCAVPSLADDLPARPAAAPLAERVFELGIENRKLAGDARVVRVKQGDVVRLRWTSDAPAVLHLHGYNIEQRVEPGAVAEMAFAARATGRFTVHLHAPGVSPGSNHHGPPLVTLEVYPR